MQYRSSPKNLRQIGEELNARYLLEGGVQRAGGTVGINVRLVDSGSDESIFADSYDRELSAENLLAVQREVALRIADALKATITVQEREQIDRAPTDNLEAYDFYLRGREYVRNPDFRYRNYRGAQRMFEQAVELDSSFALAHAWLSQAHSRIYWFRYDETDDRLHKMRSSVNRALELDRELPEAHLALATYHYFGYREYDKALEALSRAEQLRPGGADVIFLRGGIYRRQGRWEEALEAFKQAAEFDPRSPDLLAEIGQLYRFLRRYDEAERYADLALAVEPESWFAASLKAQVRLQRDGNLAAWRTLVSRHPEQALDLMRVELLHRDYPAALAALSGVADEILSFQSAYYPKSLYAGLIHLAAGEVRLAQAEFESARIMLEAAVAERQNGARHRALGLAYAGLGLKEAALREGRTAVELLPLSKDAWHWGSSHQIALAQIYTMVGEYDAAIDQIDYLLSIPSGAYAPLHGIDLSVPELRIDPTWDPIRDNPRFQALLEK
jgi:serine/threonine-protein kinase